MEKVYFDVETDSTVDNVVEPSDHADGSVGWREAAASEAALGWLAAGRSKSSAPCVR